MIALLWVMEKSSHQHLFDFIYLNFILQLKIYKLKSSQPIKVRLKLKHQHREGKCISQSSTFGNPVRGKDSRTFVPCIQWKPCILHKLKQDKKIKKNPSYLVLFRKALQKQGRCCLYWESVFLAKATMGDENLLQICIFA